jgi:hypothetical protein
LLLFLSEGNIYEGYKPNINHTTGFNFGYNLSDGTPLNILYDKYDISSKEENLREITNINEFEILNLEKIDYDYLSKDYRFITTPLYNYQSLTAHKQFSDGFQYDCSEETIYLYDKISSRPLKFIYKEVINYGEINCEKFELDKDDRVSIIQWFEDIISDIELTRRIQTYEEYRNTVEYIKDRTDLSYQQKQEWLDTYVYKFVPIYNSTGEIIGAYDWKEIGGPNNTRVILP